MTTPIFDFVKAYSESEISRFHMPGHKGRGALGFEAFDITEIRGADVLYSAEGIIDESERNLSSLYGTSHSFYSTEGSTLAIKAMLALVSERCGDERPLILAARNVHTAFIKAAALLDLDVDFIYPGEGGHLCECKITSDDVCAAIRAAKKKPSAVYLTSPDYLGNMLDIAGIVDLCRGFDIPLLVDNAHGAYLRFLENDLHPISLGATMCADSAHKTLPVLTGGAYLHISPNCPEYAERARGALSLFASTSPSYLTLCSLDLCNKQIDDGYGEKIGLLAHKCAELKKKISAYGFEVCDGEPLKITVKAGFEFADALRNGRIEPEFSDNEYTVLMLTPENTGADFEKLIDVISRIKLLRNPEVNSFSIKPHNREMTIRQAVFSPCETILVENSLGRICASPTVSCPPAVPIVVSGERITEEDIMLFKYYGVNTVSVIKKAP